MFNVDTRTFMEWRVIYSTNILAFGKINFLDVAVFTERLLHRILLAGDVLDGFL